MKRSSELRAQAWGALSGKWGMAVVAALVYFVISGVLSCIPFISCIAVLLVSLPLAYGFTIMLLNVVRGRDVELNTLGEGFKDYGRILGTMLLSSVYQFLWMLLLIIPGIIKGYSYALTPYLLKDHPELKFNAAIEESMRLMSGNKMRLFILDLTYIGWFLLCIVTFGIATLWVNPYWCTARAAFYEDLMSDLRNAGEF
jgi:uncharacterized membrane protein